MKKTIAAALLFWIALTAVAQPGPYRIIVNPENPATGIDKNALANMFLKKTTVWPNGQRVAPVDLPPSSAIRRQFADTVLKRSIGAVKNYWQQQIFSGRGLPPPELDSEAAVVRFVLSNPGAVGYVSTKADIGNAKIFLEAR